MLANVPDFTLDVRLEPDDLDVGFVIDALRAAEENDQTISRVKLRTVQYRAIMKTVGDRYGVPPIDTIMGVDLVTEEDGLTPRERSIQRVLNRDFRPTRAEQVAAFEENEREAERLLSDPAWWAQSAAAHEFSFAPS